MKTCNLLVSIYLLTAAQPLSAQLSSGSLSGTILHSNNSTIADAPIRARNEATGTDARTRSSETGRFEFTDLPAGTYRLTVNMPCCEFLPYMNDAVTVVGGRDNQFDIQMAPGNINVEGDDPAGVNADLFSRQVIPDLPVPRTLDGRPDLSGVWLFVDDPYPEDPNILDWVGPIVQERVENWFVDEPGVHCLPGTPPISNGAAFISRFVQRDDLLVVLLEAGPGFRQVYLDGRDHPENPNPTWYGKTKFLGELHDEHCVTLRTSIIGLELSRKTGLVEWFLAQKGSIKGYRRAIYTGFTTVEMARVIERVLLEHKELHGVWHVASVPINKYELLSLLSDKLKRADIEIDPDDSFVCDRSLDGSRFTEATGYAAPSWDAMLVELAQQIRQRGKTR